MRKYQQLLLLVLSCASVAILLTYKSENNRLKDVLSVMNFFGRNDAVIMRQLENATKEEGDVDFSQPMPLWQVIGDSFHSYAAYWNRNELVAGGEVLAIVAGKRGAVVNFRCSLQYDGGARSVQGKFRFQRVDNDVEDANSDFTRYNFFCRLTRDFGQPESVSFTDVTAAAKNAHGLRLRYVRVNQKPQKTRQVGVTPQLTTVCLNLVGYNRSSSPTGRGESALLQFLLHHHVVGVAHFIVYNSDELPRHTQQLARRLNMHLYLQPFNFPFSYANATERLRRIVETDCLMRNTNLARFTLLLSPQEFFYPKAKLTDPQSLPRSLQHYSAEVKRFELATFAVCVDHSNKLLMDNTLYDPEVSQPHRVFLYRPHVSISTAVGAAATESVPHSVALPVSSALIHSYVKCEHVGKDGLHDWRTSLREDFMQYLQALRNEVNVFV